MLRRLTVVLCFGLIAGACASAPIKKKDMAELAKADKLVADGCYDCMTEALAIYERIAVGKARPLIIQRIFETDVLLALRLKELAARPNERFDAARKLVPELPATFPAAKYLEIAEAVPADPGGGMPRLDVGNARAAIQVRVAGFRDALKGGPSMLLDGYLLATLDCTLPQVARASATPSTSGPTPAVSVVAFRRENCTVIDREKLAKRVTDDPRYIEAGVFVGRVRSTTPGAKEVADARLWLNNAIAKWPRSAAVLYALGALNQTVGDCRAAVPCYDNTLAEFG
jgi:hypothetical protein